MTMMLKKWDEVQGYKVQSSLAPYGMCLYVLFKPLGYVDKYQIMVASYPVPQQDRAGLSVGSCLEPGTCKL
jgi:hypothetical protein